ncbi:antifreeze protein [Mesorhizobium sp.]|uniref:antifreeze protein n=1 Tax=Mesorhizobium sp. TaxID=1871066 RepID=UPI000FE8ABE0|nr:antifreeze protein [Mesorhizobium sp.]RWF32267.1 MAG: antifreeze protein [Mesorhizobium sp.]
MLIHRLATLTGLAVATLFLAAPANALTMAECSTKYNAAKDAGTLNGQTWNQFRKAECGPGATAAAEPAKATTKAAAAEGGKGLSMADCSAKYQAAKTANKLNGMKWNDFRKAECGAAADDDDTVPAPTEATYTSEPEKPTVAAPKGVKFPTAISKKYASETPGKGRMHTCLELYYANKDANTLNGLRWIQKGGGFYSLCNAKLKS